MSHVPSPRHSAMAYEDFSSQESLHSVLEWHSDQVPPAHRASSMTDLSRYTRYFSRARRQFLRHGRDFTWKHYLDMVAENFQFPRDDEYEDFELSRSALLDFEKDEALSVMACSSLDGIGDDDGHLLLPPCRTVKFCGGLLHEVFQLINSRYPNVPEAEYIPSLPEDGDSDLPWSRFSDNGSSMCDPEENLLELTDASSDIGSACITKTPKTVPDAKSPWRRQFDSVRFMWQSLVDKEAAKRSATVSPDEHRADSRNAKRFAEENSSAHWAMDFPMLSH